MLAISIIILVNEDKILKTYVLKTKVLTFFPWKKKIRKVIQLAMETHLFFNMMQF